jgi:type IV pilus assembly protein PilF
VKALQIVMVAACLALAGCASQPSDDSALKAASPTTGDEGQERARARIHTELAAGYYEIGNMSVALEEVKEALRADPNYGPAYNIAGLVYARLNEDRLAHENFQRALRLNPNDYDALHNYGSFLCDRKQEREAIKHFLAAVRNPLYPVPDRSYVNAGLCARRSGDLAGAEEYFQQALKVRPSQPQALYQLADMSYARGDLAGARSYLGRMTQASDSSVEVLWLGVRIARRAGDRDLEASYARQLRNRYPNAPETRALNAGKFE